MGRAITDASFLGANYSAKKRGKMKTTTTKLKRTMTAALKTEEKPALAHTFRVEWVNGYGDFANDPNLTEENATLAKIKEWDLSAYAGNAWLDEFKALVVGETANIYGPGIGEFTEHVRFTGTG